MARDAFLLRIDPRVMAALRQWSDDELRSVNAQIEYLLRRALQEAGRMSKGDAGNSNAKTDGEG